MKTCQRSVLFASILLLNLTCATLFAGAITLISPVDGITVSQHNDIQKEYLDMTHEERGLYLAEKGRQRRGRFQNILYEASSVPAPVKFQWECSETDVENFTLTLSSHADFSEPVTLVTTEKEAEIDSLYINTTYYWKVASTKGVEVKTSPVGTFKTEDRTPRLIRIDKVPNVRDIGGYETLYGKRVKQGMIYRTSSLNDNAGAIYYTADELRNSAEFEKEYEEHRETDEKLIALAEQLESHIEGFEDSQLQPYALTSQWSAFRPDTNVFSYGSYHREIENLEAIPANFMGAAAEQITMNEKGVFKFDPPVRQAVAIFMQEFQAEQDGFMQIACGADQYWDLHINGKRAFDQLQGNKRGTIGTDNMLHHPVKSGSNLISVSVRCGLDTWSWCCAAPRYRVAGQKALNSMITDLQNDRNKLWRILKDRVPAKSFLTEETSRFMLETLGISSDIDLRHPETECWGMSGSPLGDSVKWFSCHANYIGNRAGRKYFTDLFNFLLEEEHYPLIITAGPARTEQEWLFT